MDSWHPYRAYLVLALICGAASTAIVTVSMLTFSHGGRISDVGMVSVAGMAAAPAIMGVGIAGFMSRDKR